MNFKSLLSATALVSSMIVVSSANASEAKPDQTATAKSEIPQTEADSPASTTAPATGIDDKAVAGADDQDILVTGSRIRSTKFDAAVPVVSLTAAELLGTRGDVSLGDALNQLPQLRSTFSQANSTGSIGTAGLSLLDLRGLGTARTLTLVNGRRVVTAVPGSYTPDVSTIPYDLVERVDLVTGGQSAIYGSDAIAGVVNFVLRRNYDGFRLRAQAGATSYGDRGTALVSAVAGKNFFDGALNITASAEYTHAESVFYADRDYLGAFDGTPAFITSQITNAPNRNFDGIPNTSFVDRGSKFSNLSTGGLVVTTCPGVITVGGTVTQADVDYNNRRRALVCTGQTLPTGGTIPYFFVFNPDGSLIRNDQSQGLTDFRALGGGVLGGLTATGVEDAQLLPSQDRFVSNLLISGDISPAFRPFAEATYVRVKVEQQSTQPTFVNSTLSPTFSVNNAFLSPTARASLLPLLPNGATTFTLFRFNNDLGTRAEFHTRETFRAVLGVGGALSDHLRYEIAGNYGRTDNFYRTGGNVLVANYNRATNAVVAPATFTGDNFVLNSQGQRVICGANATTNTFTDCVPLNVFGRGAGDQRALNYVLYTSTRGQWATQLDATAYVSGDTGGFFRLPGGPIGFSLGGEYRKEDARSYQDPITRSGATFLNPAATFDPPAVKIKEAFGELRLPLLADIFLIQELTLEGAGRISDYGGTTGSVTAWNAGAIWAPVRSLRFRGTYSRSVRAPNLSNLFATQAQTFATIADPCDQPGGTNSGNNITANPNRVANCAAAGVPTTVTYTVGGVTTTVPYSNVSASTIPGVNQGNQNLTPEIGNSFTVGAAFQPEFVPGFSLKVDYYNIRVNNVISGLTGQAIVNRCYDDPNGIDNVFCSAVFRRTTGDSTTNATFLGQQSRVINGQSFTFPIAGNGISFINQPFNFAQLKTRGVDFEAAYTTKVNENFGLNFRLVASHVFDRLSYSYITEPQRYDRIDGTLGDPKWQGAFTAQATFKNFDISYNARYVGKQIVSGLSYETFFASQGRPALNPDARPFIYYDPITYHSIRVAVKANQDKFRFYVGVDNFTNKLPPYDLTGTGNDAIYPNTGRFLYAGVETKF